MTLSLTGASGPGDFYLFITNPDGSKTTLMDSSDGFSSVDSINLAPAGARLMESTLLKPSEESIRVVLEPSGFVMNK